MKFKYHDLILKTPFIHIPFLIIYIMITLISCGQPTNNLKTKTTMETIDKPGNPYYSHTDTNKLNINDAQWKKVLPPDLFEVSRHKETEPAYKGNLWNFSGIGTYYCAACGNTLFRSDAKFASSCGWPSFFEQMNKNSVIYKEDNTYNMQRIEALCGRCGGHLGHLFDDGPPPTGKRYCMNSITLDFEPDNK